MHKAKQKIAETQKRQAKVPESKLPEKLQSLIQLIANINVLNNQMEQFQLDVSKTLLQIHFLSLYSTTIYLRR